MPEESSPNDTALKLQETAEAVTERTTSLAQLLSRSIEEIDWIPEFLARPLAILMLLAGLFLLAWLSYVVFRPLILKWVKAIIERSAYTWDNHLLGHGVFRWLTHLFPGLLIYLLVPGLFHATPFLASALKLASEVYLLVTAYLIFDSLVNAAQAIIRPTRVGRHLNLVAIAQIVKLVAALIVLILTISVLLQKPPLALLGGLGVLASVLMLVFKDVILGFVGGIQLATNRMLSIGDWLEMPSHQADGSVEEIGLTTVKVRNFDRTITTIPTYALISEPFKNWRGMSESGGRRIKRSILIDTNSIRLCTPEMLERFEQIEHISGYLKQKKEEISLYNEGLGQSKEVSRVNGRRLTNIGTFRAYVDAYLKNHPLINQNMTLLVRQLSPEGRGLPIEIYCFSSNKNWVAYEGIQADIFDHLFAIAPEFDLRAFQEPTGMDFQGLVQRLGETSTNEEAGVPPSVRWEPADRGKSGPE